MIYTNLNINNMFHEISKHLKNIKNKNYIKSTIQLHYDYNLITKEEKKELEKRFYYE